MELIAATAARCHVVLPGEVHKLDTPPLLSHDRPLTMLGFLLSLLCTFCDYFAKAVYPDF